MQGSTIRCAKNLGKEAAMVYIGPSKKVHVLHKKLLIDHSTFFSRFYARPVRLKNTSPLKYQTDGGGIHLQLLDDDVFSLVVKFLYQGSVPDLMITSDPPKALSTTVNLCCLAIDLGVEELVNRIMDQLQFYHLYHSGTPNGHFTMGQIKETLKKTTPFTPLWNYCIASIVCWVEWRFYDDGWVTELKALCLEIPEVPNSIVQTKLTHGINISDHNADYREPSQSNGFAQCEFHIHTTDKPCHLITTAKGDDGDDGDDESGIEEVHPKENKQGKQKKPTLKQQKTAKKEKNLGRMQRKNPKLPIKNQVKKLESTVPQGNTSGAQKPTKRKCEEEVEENPKGRYATTRAIDQEGKFSYGTDGSGYLQVQEKNAKRRVISMPGRRCDSVDGASSPIPQIKQDDDSN